MRLSKGFLAVILVLGLFCIRLAPVSSAPRVVYADAASIKSAISADKGRVVLVNFWATWCGLCVTEYPNLVKLDRIYRKKGLVIIAVSLDLHDDIGDKVVPFLVSRHASFRQFVLQQSDPEKDIDAFDPTWQGDLPRTLIYGRSGKLIDILPDEQSFGSFQHAVKIALRAH